MSTVGSGDRVVEPLGRVRAVLFDLDGVLVDSRAPIAGSINHALAACGLAPRPEAELHARIGDPLPAIFAELLGGEAAGRVRDCIEAYRERYRKAALEETTLVPGVDAVLARLARERPLAVATSKPVEFAEPILDRLGVRDRFACVVGPPLEPAGAESKLRVVERALAALGIVPGPFGAPPPAALVGDRHHDMRAARELGLAAVGVTWGIGSADELAGAGASWLLDAPSQLEALFAHEPGSGARRRPVG